MLRPVTWFGSLSTQAKLITKIFAGTVVAAGLVTTWIAWTADRAFVTIPRVAFVPVVPIVDTPVRVEFSLRNGGRVPATILGMATDRFDDASAQGRYGYARIGAEEIPAGESVRIISDLGTKPLIFNALQLAAFRDGREEFKIVGFVKYSDAVSTLLGNTVLGYCFVWDAHDTPTGNFSSCSDGRYNFRRRYWLNDGLSMRDVTGGSQAVSPTTVPPSWPDPRYPPQTLEIEH
jgi:hypothetical protein